MESWRDIPGYEGIYQASNMGRIRTCAGKTTYTEWHGVRHWKQRVLKQKVSNGKNGRLDARVDLWRDGSEKTWLVARLIGLTWCDGYTPSMTINHVNGNSMDNRADNLEWLPLKDNIRHAFENNLCGCQFPVILQTEENKVQFRSLADASRYLGRNSGYISNALKRHQRVSSVSGVSYSVSLVPPKARM